MNDDRNRSQIIRIDARNCFVESLNDAFEIGKAHFTFASYDLSKPSGQRQTNSIQIYIDMAEVLELCRKLVGGQWRLGLQRRVCRRIKGEEWLHTSGLRPSIKRS